MLGSSDPLKRTQARRYLDQINEHILHGQGEIMEMPGKLSLVWNDKIYDIRRFLAVKPSGDDALLINGRRYPATETGLKQGLKICLVDMQLIKQ